MVLIIPCRCLGVVCIPNSLSGMWVKNFKGKVVTRTKTSDNDKLSVIHFSILFFCFWLSFQWSRRLPTAVEELHLSHKFTWLPRNPHLGIWFDMSLCGCSHHVHGLKVTLIDVDQTRANMFATMYVNVMVLIWGAIGNF